MKLNGPGKYDEECARVMREFNADGVFLIVIEGDKGNGASFKMHDAALMHVMPVMLEGIAKQMRRDAKHGAN
ncbi:hypothetical protein [Burkholderia pseudomallei]|uniref:hypothetical protein n=1 Tax=Burkholderia pseudomallei TaxID=28450 RepID=UPI00190E109B|nr:hypothetical protein [Burkholderia pseudomallei]MBK3333538.1 hypothetical protein [Burkholderia pseudomallei]